MKKTTLKLIALSLLISGCCKALPPEIEITINDANGDNVLSNVSSTDSTWTWYGNQGSSSGPLEIINSGNNSVLLISTSSINSGEDRYILVDSSDIDTINIVYEIKGYNCNLKSKVDHFYYNGIKFEGGKKDAVLTAIKY